MGFFKRKNKSANHLKALNENEIQQKLYGEFEEETTARYGASFSKAHSKVPSKPQASWRDHGAEASDDLFDSASRTNQKSGAVKVPTDDLRREAERMDRLSELAQKEKKGAAKKPQQPAQSKGPKGMPRPVRRAAILQTLSGFLWFWLKKVLLALFRMIVFCFRFLFKVLTWMVRAADFRSVEVRRFFYWFSGTVILLSLFAGIHFLNVKREAAMQAPRDTRTVVPETVNKESRPAAAQDPKKVARPAGPEVLAPASQAIPEAIPEERPSLLQPQAAETRDARYVVQIATYINEQDAVRVVKQLQDDGWSRAFLQIMDRPSRRVFYSVFIGRFKNFKEAQTFFEKFKTSDSAKPFQDAFVRLLQ